MRVSPNLLLLQTHSFNCFIVFLSCRVVSAVTPTAQRRPVESIRWWSKARSRVWVRPVLRWRQSYRSVRCKQMNHLCAHLTVALVRK